MNLIHRGIAVPAKMTEETGKKERELFLCYTSLTDADMLGLVRSGSSCSEPRERRSESRGLERLTRRARTYCTGGHEIAEQIGSSKADKARADALGAFVTIAEDAEAEAGAEGDGDGASALLEAKRARRERQAKTREIAHSSVVAFSFDYVR